MDHGRPTLSGAIPVDLSGRDGIGPMGRAQRPTGHDPDGSLIPGTALRREPHAPNTRHREWKPGGRRQRDLTWYRALVTSCRLSFPSWFTSMPSRIWSV